MIGTRRRTDSTRERYSADDLKGKAACKAALQRAFGLPVDENATLIAGISRLADQKGFDLFAKGFEKLVSSGVQYILLGTGERKYHELFTELARKYPQSFALKIAYDNALAHLIEAGSDMFLMPSQYEPCGLNQLYSLRYGTVPVVRAVGGLEDTIRDDPAEPDVADRLQVPGIHGRRHDRRRGARPCRTRRNSAGGPG